MLFSMSQFSGQLKFYCQKRMFKSMFFHLVKLKMMGWLICEFKDGLIYKNNPLWTSSVKTIKIMLYCDEPVCAKPLGNKIKKWKFFALYFVLGNLPSRKRSMLSSINLAILCKTKCYERKTNSSYPRQIQELYFLTFIFHNTILKAWTVIQSLIVWLGRRSSKRRG